MLQWENKSNINMCLQKNRAKRIAHKGWIKRTNDGTNEFEESRKVSWKMRLNRIWRKHITLSACSNPYVCTLKRKTFSLSLKYCFPSTRFLLCEKKVRRWTSFWFRFTFRLAFVSPGEKKTRKNPFYFIRIFFYILFSWSISVFIDILCGRNVATTTTGLEQFFVPVKPY